MKSLSSLSTTITLLITTTTTNALFQNNVNTYVNANVNHRLGHGRYNSNPAFAMKRTFSVNLASAGTGTTSITRSTTSTSIAATSSNRNQPISSSANLGMRRYYRQRQQQKHHQHHPQMGISMRQSARDTDVSIVNSKDEKDREDNVITSKSASTPASTSASDSENDNKKNMKKSQTKTKNKSSSKQELKSVSARYVHDNDLVLTTDKEGRLTARPADNINKDATASTNTSKSTSSSSSAVEKENKERQKDEMETKEKKEEDIKGTKNIKDVKDEPDAKRKELQEEREEKTGKSTEKKTSTTLTAETSSTSSIDEKRQEKDANTIKKGESNIKRIENDSESNQDTDSNVDVEIDSKSSSISSSSVPIKAVSTSTKVASTKATTTRIKIPGITLPAIQNTEPLLEVVPKPVISGGFNVVLTHCTADFDSLASAVGLAKLWSTPHKISKTINSTSSSSSNRAFESESTLPTFVVLPRGAHPSVQRFLALHKHLFPIRSLRSLPNDLTKLNRLGLVDAQRRDRVGPAEILIGNADRVTIVDHHIDGTSDIPEATDYIVDQVGSVSTMVAEKLRECGFELTEAEATLLALGIHADTGSLCFDSTTTRDAEALAWVMKQGASQAAIAENAHASLSQEQQGVLTNALINTNSTVVHGVTVSTVLLSADGFINGLAAVTQDALELSSSDVFLLAVVYDPKSGGRGKKKGKKKVELGIRLQSKLFKADEEKRRMEKRNKFMMEAEAWKGGERALKLRRLRAAFDNKDTDGSGYLEEDEIVKATAKSGVVASEKALKSLMSEIDTDGDGRVDFDEFVAFYDKAEEMQKEQEQLTGKKPTTMIVIGRVKAGVNMKHVNLNRLFQQFGGGGHAKAASCTVRLEDESTAGTILQGIVDELIETGLMQQATVGDFMTSPVLSAKPTMTEKQVEDLFVRYDVRALPVVDDKNDVVGLVTYKEVAAAKQRLWNKEQKRIRQEAKHAASNKGKDNSTFTSDGGKGKARDRKLGSALKGWMKQHVKTVEASMTMAEVEHMLLENDVGCIPVVLDGTTQLVGMVTRTDLLRQHRYYPSLHYNNKGFADSIAARKPIIELRKKLKQFDLEED